MKTSSPDVPKPPQPKSILLIGPPGGGKTTLMLQFPHLRVVDCDTNLDGPEYHIRNNMKLPLSYTYDKAAFDDDDKPIDIHMCFDRVCRLLDECKVDPTCQCAGLDSLTWINEYIIRKILFLQKRGEMEARDWIPFKSKMLDLLASKLRGMGKTVICTVHETKNWLPNPKDIMTKILDSYSPSVQGSIVDYFGAFFTDMWRCEARLAAGNRVEYVLTTNRTTKSDLKNSCGLPQEVRNPTFAELNKYLKITT